MKKQDLVSKLVDMTLEQGPPSESGGKIGNEDESKEEVEEMFAVDNPEKIEKQVDFLIDICTECGEENDLKSVPSQDADEELDRVHDAIAGYGDPEDEEDEYPPGPKDASGDIYDDDSDMDMGQQLEFVLKEEEYKVFFKSMMDKEGISSIKDLTGDKKKSFFNKVDASWKAKKETD